MVTQQNISKKYIEGANPVFCVGEYRDSCSCTGYGLDNNQVSYRQRIMNWIDAMGKLSTAFDFRTNGILQNKAQFWCLRDSQGKPPRVMGCWPSRAVTFIETIPQAQHTGLHIRRRQDIHNRYSVRILEAQRNPYSAIIGENFYMSIKDGSWCPAGREWLATSRQRYVSMANAMIPVPSFFSFLIPYYWGMGATIGNLA